MKIIKQIICGNVIMLKNLTGLCILYILFTIVSASMAPLNILLTEQSINSISHSFEGKPIGCLSLYPVHIWLCD